jgi:3-deoxy-D-manno-octulosonic-acid transferase
VSRVALWAYGLLVWLIQPLVRRKLARRAKAEPLYGEHIPERFGVYESAASSGWVWVHAVSLGETRVAAVLIDALRHQWPGMKLLLTHGTATGRAAGAALLREGDVQVWQPWDTVAATQAFVQHFRPRVGILMETEVWPNLVQACKQGNVPLALVNARLSDKSLRQSQRMAWLSKPTFQSLSMVLAQTPEDAQRFAQLGVSVKAVLGNLKFDQAPDARQLQAAQTWRQGRAGGKPVVLFASSREGEEALWLDALRDMGQAANAVQWLIVPRHPQRFDEVAALIEAQGFQVQRRSSVGNFGEAENTIWLGDTMGEMVWYYGTSDVALLGGSFAPLGGQNLIEACACACPVVMGSHTFNFAQASDMAAQQGAAIRVSAMPQAVVQASALVQDSTSLQAARQAALAFARSQQGSVAATAQHLRSLVQ